MHPFFRSGFASTADVSRRRTRPHDAARRMRILLLTLGFLVVPNLVLAQTFTTMIYGMVWQDLNRDGIRDPLEMNLGRSGFTVELWNASSNTLMQSTVTDSLGRYSLTGIHGGSFLFRVKIRYPRSNTLSPMRTDVDPAINNDFGPGGEADELRLYAQTEVMTGIANVPVVNIDAGVAPVVIRIGNKAWLDWNRDGIQQEEELGIPGIAVELWNSDRTHRFDQTMTDAEGIYELIAPGNIPYRIYFSLPEGAVYTLHLVGSNRLIDSDALATPPSLAGWTEEITFPSNVIANTSYDAGYFMPDAADIRLESVNVPPVVFPGSSVSWGVRVRERLGASSTPVRVRALAPSGLANFQWSCVASGGAACGGPGSGNLDLVASLPANAELNLAFSGQVNAAMYGDITSTVTAEVSLPQFDFRPADNTLGVRLRKDGLFANGFDGI